MKIVKFSFSVDNVEIRESECDAEWKKDEKTSVRKAGEHKFINPSRMFKSTLSRKLGKHATTCYVRAWETFSSELAK